MKFTRRPGVVDGRPYRTYRELTREDFRRHCAYCFRHEAEVGGAALFDQDHFQPNVVDHGAKERIYTNLYWCCKECNAPQNKGQNWPSRDELARGEFFCDSCSYDPVGVDYEDTAGNGLRPLTAAGVYTIRVLRLNDRSSLVELRDRKRRIQDQYRANIELYKLILARAKVHPQYVTSVKMRELCTAVERAIASIQSFIDADPFVLRQPPPPTDVVPLTSMIIDAD